MKILVIDTGVNGRGHALVWKIAQSPKVKKIYCTLGNAGTADLAVNVNIPINDIENLSKFALKEKIDITIVGSEAPLVDGIVDQFEKSGFKIIGPSQKAAQIEGSKVFSKKLMLKYGIPTAKFAVFDDYGYASTFLKTQKYPLVVKADGQCAGKGVTVCKNQKEAQIFLKGLMVDKIFGLSGKQIIIEECLTGLEVSFMVATDGKNFVSLLPSQDHKPVYDGDHGPNTGGMGAYAPVPFVDRKLVKRIEKEIVEPTLSAMVKEGCLYKGILYPGLILTSDGPKVLEYNCRFGDPETQPLMFNLKSDIVDIFQAILKDKVNNLELKWYDGFSVCVALTSKGYPGDYEKGKEILGLDKLDKIKDIYAFHAGTKIVDEKIVSSGGRVLGITGRGKTLKSAIKLVYKYIGRNSIHFSGMHFRKDIGSKGFSKQVSPMKLSYKKSGVNYNLLDPVKKLAQVEGLKTKANFDKSRFMEVSESRGESAYLIEDKDCYYAFVEEGLGTKNLIADEMEEIGGKTYYEAIAQDCVAAIINDLVTSGARPLSILAYWAVGDSRWFENIKKATSLVKGWRKACDLAGVTWGGGETPTLKEVVYPEAIDLAGSAFGVVRPKKRLVTSDKLRAGDVIIFLGSSGIHANGLTLARQIAKSLIKGYQTKLESRKSYGEELLTPTIIYSKLIQDLLDNKIDIHYLVDITGHGWRKIMRAKQAFTYIIDNPGKVPEIFNFIKQKSNSSPEEMYATFNMGVGFALFTNKKNTTNVIDIAKKHKIKAWVGGKVEEGEKKVIIKPLNITFTKDDLNIR